MRDCAYVPARRRIEARDGLVYEPAAPDSPIKAVRQGARNTVGDFGHGEHDAVSIPEPIRLRLEGERYSKKKPEG